MSSITHAPEKKGYARWKKRLTDTTRGKETTRSTTTDTHTLIHKKICPLCNTSLPPPARLPTDTTTTTDKTIHIINASTQNRVGLVTTNKGEIHRSLCLDDSKQLKHRNERERGMGKKKENQSTNNQTYSDRRCCKSR